MLPKKRAVLLTASLLTGSVLGAGALSYDGAAAHAASINAHSDQDIAHKDAVKKLHELYNSAYSGQMPNNAKGLIINDSTQKDVHKRWGPPEEPITKDNPFDIYHATMGQPGYGFSYHKDKTIKEIRYFGTNVERQHNLGGITVKVLSHEIGSADHIRSVPGTGEVNYIYNTDNFQIQFIIGKDGTTSHVNLKENK